MPTVRLRDASEYPDPARKLFELSKRLVQPRLQAPARDEPRHGLGSRFRRAAWARDEAGHGARGVEPRREGDGGRRWSAGSMPAPTER